jgi:hypothetical protein
MGARFLTDLADVCRRAGLSVVEDAGWQFRARSSGGFDGDRPWCVMWHHTASNASPQSDVNYICRGSQDAPLANVYLARDGSVWICAGGATNTNGKGGPLTFSRGTVPADSMNTHAIGIEAANTGTGEHWPQVQIDSFFTLSNALTAAYGMLPTDCAGHVDWSPGRKIDPAVAFSVLGPWRPGAINASGSWRLADVRTEAVARSGGQPPSPPSQEDIVFTILAVNGHPEALGGMMDARGICAQATWLNPGRYDTCIRLGAPIVTVNDGDLGGIDLLGPLPPSFRAEMFANVVT